MRRGDDEDAIMLAEQSIRDLFAVLREGHAVAISPEVIADVIRDWIERYGLRGAEEILLDMEAMSWRIENSAKRCGRG